MYNPESTYRLQFSKDFTLEDAKKVLPYLNKLGIKTIYASPIFQAVKDSTHGYDVVHPNQLNKEIARKGELEELIGMLKDAGMGWIQDIVPNHMGYSTLNPWVYDLLQKGKQSEYYPFFDIIDGHPEEKLMLPFFGKSLDKLLDDNELSVCFSIRGLSIKYFEHFYPVSSETYPYIFSLVTRGDKPAEIIDFQNKISQKYELDAMAGKLFAQAKKNEAIGAFINNCLSAVNQSREKLEKVLSLQHYQPVYWKDTGKTINFRRFFTINGLICLKMEDEQVFHSYHEFIKELLEEYGIDGLRVDHVDGLFDPGQYLDRLRRIANPEKYIVVEKILEKDEILEEKWPVQGTTGYDFLGMVNNLMTNTESEQFFKSHYQNWKKKADYQELIYQKKRFILHQRLKGELENLTNRFYDLDKQKLVKINRERIKQAIGEFLIHCPVYKIYNAPSTFSTNDMAMVNEIFSKALARKSNKPVKKELKLLKDLFLVQDEENNRGLESIDWFFRRCMQFSGPLMAKGVEDTLFYNYNPLVSHNEVGDSPGFLGIKISGFHKFMVQRQEKFPLTMNALATHDTKRGEDARARINALSLVPGKWIEHTNKWHEMNLPFKTKTENGLIPTKNDEYFIYQAICGHLPMNGNPDLDFVERLKKYIVKSLREAKENSSWSEVDEQYEQETIGFITKILLPSGSFLQSVKALMEILIPAGIVSSISQLIIKNMAPGVPDLFQGTETWNLSFVDPDNRDPVDFKYLATRLDKMLQLAEEDLPGLINNLWKNPVSGEIKQYITYLTLQLRNNHPDLFLSGEYIPLKLKGEYKNEVIAFARKYKGEYLVVAVPLDGNFVSQSKQWLNTRLVMPAFGPVKYTNCLTGKNIKPGKELSLDELFKDVPFGILKGIPNQPKRSAGILMHISSLPGSFGIGDFGKEARNFVDFLAGTGQRYWQILPLTSTSKDSGHSPYSSPSAFAANTLFIDPVGLEALNLLSAVDISKYKTKSKGKVDFDHAEKCKEQWLALAYRNFMATRQKELERKYNRFKKREKPWLDDYARFVVLKAENKGKPWNEWPEEYRDRQEETMKQLDSQKREELEKVKFGQFICSIQWQSLKHYANQKGIEIFGDIPIYNSYDSADVWSNPGLFLLNEDKSMKVVAGVPPDYFNANGQLWGMPIFNWQEMKKDNFQWWINRIGKNLQWYDLLRLDHFRGFSAYWEVPSDHEVALNGQWVKGPADDLFDEIKAHFPDLPIVAEDLGQIDQDVYDLRDKYGLPGMKVVQFGFGENMAFLQHAPNNHSYNSLVYTGTHDNNTMKGWFRTEAKEETLDRFFQYTGVRLNEKNCAREFIRLAYSSVAKIAIVQMQDWLGLDEKSRMNFPSTTSGNWLWRMKSGEPRSKLAKEIRKQVKTFGRY